MRYFWDRRLSPWSCRRARPHSFPRWRALLSSPTGWKNTHFVVILLSPFGWDLTPAPTLRTTRVFHSGPLGHDSSVSPCGLVRVLSVSGCLSGLPSRRGLDCGKQKLRTLISTLRFTGSPRSLSPLLSWVEACWPTSASSSNLWSSRTFLTVGYSGTVVSLK